jgi:hypothetical protein
MCRKCNLAYLKVTSAAPNKFFHSDHARAALVERSETKQYLVLCHEKTQKTEGFTRKRRSRHGDTLFFLGEKTYLAKY